jgi:spoIIIJ-associated protein
MENQIQTIKEIIETLVDKMSVDAEVEVVKTPEGLHANVQTKDESGLLIGDNGRNLISFRHVVKKMARKRLQDDYEDLSVDINSYQAKKIEELKNIAWMTAQRVRYFKKEVYLKPMTSYERRIIHLTLRDSPDIRTESVGEDPQRQVVIKPIN